MTKQLATPLNWSLMIRIISQVGFMIVGMLLTGCVGGKALKATQADETPRLAVISAFDAELDKLRSAASITETRTINGRSFHVGKLAGNDVVLLLSGVSMVNAAMTTQSLLDNFTVRAIVFSGIAGGVNPNLNVGDVTIPSQWGQYQEHIFARETATGWDTGRYTKEFANYGMMFPRTVPVTRNDDEKNGVERRFWFQADPKLLETARQVAGRVHLNKCTPKGDCLASEPKVVVGGSGVSGATFVDNASYRVWVWDTFHADALDMETAAVAHVAYINRVPYVAFRSLSDLAGGGPGKNEGAIFSALAADNAASVVLTYLRELAEVQAISEPDTRNR